MDKLITRTGDRITLLETFKLPLPKESRHKPVTAPKSRNDSSGEDNSDSYHEDSKTESESSTNSSTGSELQLLRRKKKLQENISPKIKIWSLVTQNLNICGLPTNFMSAQFRADHIS